MVYLLLDLKKKYLFQSVVRVTERIAKLDASFQSSLPKTMRIFLCLCKQMQLKKLVGIKSLAVIDIQSHGPP